jgi:hypothetical protein
VAHSLRIGRLASGEIKVEVLDPARDLKLWPAASVSAFELTRDS